MLFVQCEVTPYINAVQILYITITESAGNGKCRACSCTPLCKLSPKNYDSALKETSTRTVGNRLTLYPDPPDLREKISTKKTLI